MIRRDKFLEIRDYNDETKQQCKCVKKKKMDLSNTKFSRRIMKMYQTSEYIKPINQITPEY